MAQLSNLLVTGSSRLLGKLFCSDISVGNSLSVKTLSATNFTATNITTSGLTVNGNATTTGTLNVGNSQANGKISINGKVSIRDYANNGWLGINDTLAWTNGVYFGETTVRTDGIFQVGDAGNKVLFNQSSAKFTVPVTINNSLAANNITATNVTVNDTLKAFKYELNTIQDLGGEFCVSPTIFIQSGATVNVSKASAITITVSIKDTKSITSDTIQGIRWSTSSKIKFQGKIDGVAIRCNGIMASKLNTDANTMALTLTVDSGIADHFATTVNGASYSDISVMLYQRYGKKVGSTDNVYSPVGIRMSAYGSVNSAPYVDIWGSKSSSDPDTIYTIPSVRLGYLDGLKCGTYDCVGYGLYADNVYLNGTIVSNSGTIGGFNITTNALSNGAWGTDKSVLMCTGTDIAKSVGGSSAISGWCFTAGSKFGVTTSGDLYASNANISGKVTATEGNIGGFNINKSALYVGTDSITSNAKGTYIGTDGIRQYNSSVAYVDIKNGQLTCMGASISGYVMADNIVATNGFIGEWSIEEGRLYAMDNDGKFTILNANKSVVDENGRYPVIIAGGNDWDATIGNFVLTSNGYCEAKNIKATGGTIGGWNIENGKLYAGDGSKDNPVAVMQMPQKNNLWTFAVGGTSHSNYSDCPFRVSKDGKMRASWANLAGWTITDGKIYSGDPTVGDKVSVLQSPNSVATWMFATGGTSHTDYSDCPFRVSKDGHVFSTEVNVGVDDDTRGRASTLITNMGVTIKVNESTTNFGLLMEQTGSTGNPYFGVTLQGKLYARSSTGFCQKGTVACKSTANTPTKTSVTFSSSFDTVPTVVVTPVSSVPGTVVKGVSVLNVTKNGFDIYVTRSDSNSMSVSWIAVL